MSIKEMIDKAVEITKASNELIKESSYQIYPDGENVCLGDSMFSKAEELGVEVSERLVKNFAGYERRKSFIYEGIEFYTYETD